MALNGREKALIGGLTLVGAVLAAYTFVHDPLTSRRAEAGDRLDQVESQLVQEQKRLIREGNLEERRAKVRAREQVIDAWVPGRNSAAMLIWHLSQAERLSGGRITAIEVGEKELVDVDGQVDGQQGQEPPSQPQEAAASPTATTAGAPGQEQAQDEDGTETAGGQAQAPPSSENPMTTLVRIPLEMKVDGKFAEHLIFNQYLEDAPLFLNTHGFELIRGGELDLEKVGKLVQGGNTWLAGQVLSESPPVGGVYRLSLYFKASKAGPSTEEMRFESEAGRIDPFVMAAVDEFIRALQEHFAGQVDRSVDNHPPTEGRDLPNFGQMG